MNNKFVYTPGPTNVRENVRLERSKETTNPDVDLDFVEFYRNTCEKIGEIINTKNSVYILSGEGILGLEAACASLTEKGDRVLVIENGIFGRGFNEFIEMYGGKVVYFSGDYSKSIDINKLNNFLNMDSDFKYATVVHCDTPTGMLNDVGAICKLLKEYGILTVVDSVAAMVGEDIKVDDWKIDIACGGSQKAFSAPVGLTMVSVSDEAKKAMDNRKTKIVGFYCNLNIWRNYYEDKWFPYTMPISDIMGLSIACDNILNEGKDNIIKRHKIIGEAVRESTKEFGLELFLESGFSNTVTVIKIPDFIGAINLQRHIKDKYNVILATSLYPYEDKVIRIGHMGENANINQTLVALNALENGLKDLGFKTEKSLVKLFMKKIQNSH